MAARAPVPTFVLILAFLLVTACSRDDAEPGRAEQPEPTTAESAEPSATPAIEPEDIEKPLPAEASELAGTAWTLVRIASMDDTVATPAGDAVYTITFNPDGTAGMQVDCNRGRGNWDSPTPGQVTFGPMALTRAMCPPDSLHDRFVRELEYVRSYVLEDDHLHLATMADGSILEFEPLAE